MSSNSSNQDTGINNFKDSLVGFGDAVIRFLVRFFQAEWSGAVLAIVILGITIELFAGGETFFHPSNLMTILNNSAAIGVIAGGMTLVIISAGIDLSVGSVMGMIAALTGYVSSYWGFPPVMAILFGLCLGLMVGLLNGTFIAYFGMPAFIVTLAGLSIWRGVGHLSTGAQATPRLPALFDYFGRFNPLSPFRNAYREGSLPNFLNPLGNWINKNWIDYFRTFQMSMIILIVFFVLLSIIINNTKFGRYVYAIGSNEEGSRQAGINTRLYKLIAYLICSMCVAFGAMLFLGRAPYAKSDYGQMWELDAIAAVVIGGTSLFGGRGSVIGTFLGIILLKLINNGLTLAQLETFWQMIVTGMIIIMAVGIDIVRQQKSPFRVRQMVLAVAAVLALLVVMTPGAKTLRSWVHISEHNSAVALEETLKAKNKHLAPTQKTRIMDTEELDAAHAAVKKNTIPAVGFMILFLLAAVHVFRPDNKHSFILAGLFVASTIPLVLLGYSVAAPFLILGAILLAGSTLIDYLFERAIELSETAG
ncbi:MAG: ABC transporter permease [Deltaproteobacteria bacterium]|nr:ABC transporter permease [Deltaproteobacteria bacterium]